MSLRFFGYETEEAEGGEAGIEKAKKSVPDLILCDVNMPGMDGRGVLRAVRNDPVLANCQVVLITGNRGQNPRREGMDLGADDYLAKPFDIDQLRTCVLARLRRAQMYRRLESGMLRRHAEIFGSTLPHEFMTPLNGILGFAEILKEDFGKITRGEALQMLGDIETCARRLHRTLMNYLLLMNIEMEGNIGPPERPLRAEQSAELVRNVAAEAARRADRAADLSFQLGPVSLRCRESELRAIAEHLVENALGYSPAGSPVFVALRNGGSRSSLVVEDKGRGMTSEQLEQIGAFTQFERKRYEQQGLGIGLAIVTHLVKRNRGQIAFRSTPGAGTTVTVEFESS